MKKINEEIVSIGGYTFHIRERRTIVALVRNGDAKEMARIGRLYRKIKASRKSPTGRSFARMKYQRCENPECNIVVCLLWSRFRSLRKMHRRIFHSEKCSAKMIPHPLLSNEIKRERRLIREFKKSNLPLQIREVLDLVQKPCPWNMLKLHLLIKKAPEEMKKVLQEIYRANNYPAAQQIINNSKDSPIGDRILSLIEKP